MQVLPDFPGFHPLSLADHEDLGDQTTLEQWAELLQAKEMQQSCIRRFLDLEEGGRVAQPKRHRKATFWLLKALNHALKLATGRGLEGWVQRPNIMRLLQEPAQALVLSHFANAPRALSIVADQAGTGVAAAAFLQHHLGLSVALLMDPPHRFWNSEKLGLVQGDGWETIALTSLVFNINYGPWQTGGWLAQLSGAHSEYFSRFAD